MKTTVKILMLAGLFLVATAISSQAVPEYEHHHPGTEGDISADTMPEMMMEKMQGKHTPEMMHDMPCKAAGATCNGPCMTTTPIARHHIKDAVVPGMMLMDQGMRGMKLGMMQQRMDHEFFLDQVKTLGLSPDQVARLKAIRSDCRKENLRNAAELQILRLDLQDLLNDYGWSLKTAEALIRKIQDLDGDLLVRHLQALSEARNVLTAEQLQKADNSGEDGLEDLFE